MCPFHFHPSSLPRLDSALVTSNFLHRFCFFLAFVSSHIFLHIHRCLPGDSLSQERACMFLKAWRLSLGFQGEEGWQLALVLKFLSSPWQEGP